MRLRRIFRVCSAPLQLSMVLLGLWGCSMMDPQQDIPSYLIVPALLCLDRRRRRRRHKWMHKEMLSTLPK